MNKSEHSFNQLPIGDDIVFNLIDSTTIGINNGNEILNPRLSPFNSTKVFVDKLANTFLRIVYPEQIFKEGMKAKVLEPGKKWVTGIIRLRLVIEFIPEEPENNNKTGQLDSTLDDLRNIQL